MYPFLLSLSLIATAVGVFAIGFGIPNRDFSLGDMLIIVGTVAIVGGMIMFGLAAAVRQLRRIADGMAPRPAPRRPPVPEGADAAANLRPELNAHGVGPEQQRHARQAPRPSCGSSPAACRVSV